MASSKFEFRELWGDSQQMDIPAGVFVKRHGFKQDVVVIGGRCNFIDKIDNLVNCWANFKGVWVHLFADFTLEAFPIKGTNIHVLGGQWFFLFLGEHPRLQALEMDQSY